MIYAFTLFLFVISNICFADTEVPAAEAPRRLGMIDAPDGREMHKLMDNVSSHCNSGEFVDFMNCFTKKKAASIRKTMKALFSKHINVTMNIVSVDVISMEDAVAKFNLEYVWDSDNVDKKSIIKSTIIAKKESDLWKIDSEEVVDVRHVAKREDAPKDFNFGGGGQVAFNQNDDFLPRDIAKRPGGCANGQCNIR